MRIRKLLLLPSASLMLAILIHAQDVLSVDQRAFDQHVNHEVAPVYPPIAKAARVQGTVVFDLRVGATGKIESMKVVSGPPMLQQAATDCLKQWTFHPFGKDGAAIAATGRYSIDFSLGKDAPTANEEKIAGQYFPLADQCRKAVTAHTDYAAAAQCCKQAADTASEFGPDVRFIEKRSAYVWAAWAFIYSNDAKSALFYASKAVEVANLGHDDNSGNNAAYGVRGITEGKAGNFAAADQDLSVAEDFERKGITWADREAPSLSPEYKRSLAQELRFHAQVLQALNRPDDAKKKLDEAETLN